MQIDVNFMPDFLENSFCMVVQNMQKTLPFAFEVWMTGKESIGKNYRLQRKNYPCYLLTYTYSGDATMEIDGQKHHLKAGDLAFVDCNQPHVFHPTQTPWKIGYIHCVGGNLTDLYHRFIAAYGNVLSNFPQDVFDQKLVVLQTTLQQMKGINDRYSILYDITDVGISKQISLALYAMLLEIDAILCQNDSSSFLAPAIKFMESNYMYKITLSQIAQTVFLSKCYFERRFKAEKNVTPLQYLNGIRIENAKVLLLYSDMSVLEVAQQVGFSDAQMLTKLFVKDCGLTPIRYRKTIREGNYM